MPRLPHLRRQGDHLGPRHPRDPSLSPLRRLGLGVDPMKVMTTPWVRAHLEADPVEAMAVEERRRTGYGTLRLFGKSARGPWTAIYHAPGDTSFDGSRGAGRTVIEAVDAAMGRVA